MTPTTTTTASGHRTRLGLVQRMKTSSSYFRQLLWTSALIATCAVSAPAFAHSTPDPSGNPFAPRLFVNGLTITNYEFEQRKQFMTLLRAPGNPEVEAMKALTEDKLRLAEADRLGITITEEALSTGMADFAARAQLSTEEFIAALEQGGVAGQTFRDFVTAGLLFREVLRSRYAGQVTVTEAEVDREINATVRRKPLRLLLSELVIPLEPGAEADAIALATRLSDEIKGEAAFAAAARRYSRAPTAGSGGRLDWLPQANLPGPLGAQVLALGPGEVSDPVVVPNAVVLFQLRDVAEDTAAEPVSVSVEYAEYLIPNDPAEIARVRNAADVCMDLYGLAEGLPEAALTISKKPMSEIPGDIGLELAKLDPGESSVALTRGPARMLLMLCSREAVADPQPTREEIQTALTNRKIDGLSAGYMEELRAAAIIREP